MTDPLIEDVSDTSLWIAAYRAKETERPDALFRDPLASRLAGERGRRIAASMPESWAFAWTTVIRTCIIDDLILAGVKKGVDTILNLGAGLDTRPYRLDLPRELRWIEVDYPRIIDLKEEQLQSEAPACRLERVKLDLARVDERRSLLERVNRESDQVFVLTEGVIPYLTTEDVGSLARDLRAQETFRHWIADYSSPWLGKKMRRHKRHRDSLRNAPLKFEPPDWEEFFKQQGWRLAEMRYHVPEGERLHRPLPLPWMLRLVRPFLPRAARERIRRMMGYGLLVPA